MLRGQRALGALGLAAQLLQRAAVLADVRLVLLLDQLDEVVHNAVVKILASQVRVSRGGDDLQQGSPTSDHNASLMHQVLPYTDAGTWKYANQLRAFSFTATLQQCLNCKQMRGRASAHLKYAIVDGEHGDIKGATAQV